MSKSDTTKTKKPSLATGKLVTASELAISRLVKYVEQLEESVANHLEYATPQRRSVVFNLAKAQYEQLLTAMDEAAETLEKLAGVVQVEQHEAIWAKKEKAVNFIVTSLSDLDLDEASTEVFVTSYLKSKGVCTPDTLAAAMKGLGFEQPEFVQDQLPETDEGEAEDA